jgi:Intracellular proteinase inhibitor
VKKADGFSVTLRSEPRVAEPSGTFSLTLNVRNLSGETREFTLSTPQMYEFLAFDADGGQVWRWSEGTMYAQVVTPVKMADGESQVFKAAWNTEETSAGEYEIQGYFLGIENLRPSVAVEIKP